MKTKLAAFAVAVGLAALVSAQTGSGKAEDESAIRKVGEQYAAAWNSGNASQAAALFTEDGTFTNIRGETMKGRPAIEQDLAKSEIGTAKTGMTLSVETESIRFLQPDLAVVTGSTRFAGAPDGQQAGHYMTVVKRMGAEWKVAAVHAAVAPPAPASAGTSPAVRPTGTTGSTAAAADELLSLEREWEQAARTKDVATLNRILADDFVEVDPMGETRGKQASIAEISAGDLVFESFDQVEVKPRVYGDSAVVSGTSIVKGSYKGEDISGTYRWTDTLVKRDGRWQVVASQATRVVVEEKEKK